MTAGRWPTTRCPRSMLRLLGDSVDQRKSRFYICACARRIWDRLVFPECRAAVEAAEQFADGYVEASVLDQANSRVMSVYGRGNGTTVGGLRIGYASTVDSREHVSDRLSMVTYNAARSSPNAAVEFAAQADLLRDIFGNPFRPVVFASEWRTSAAVALADAMYQPRDFGPMPVLADALEEAGCTNADILAHCRGDGSHVRGCWVVDLVLGKS